MRAFNNLSYILEGNAEICVGDETIPAKPGYMLRAHSGVNHGIVLADKSSYLKTIEMKFRLLEPTLKERVYALPTYESADVPILRKIPEELIDIALRKSPCYKELMRIKFMELLCVSVDAKPIILSDAGIPDRDIPVQNDALVQHAIQFMSEHLAEDLPLERFARECAISKHYFFRKFKLSTGMSPTEYIRKHNPELYFFIDTEPFNG